MKNFSALFYLLNLSICLLTYTAGFTQNTNHERKITHQIETFFKGLNAKDTIIIKSTLTKDVNLKSILIKGEEKQLVHEDIHQFLKQIARLSEDLLIREEIKHMEINLRFPLANVFTDYTFYINDEKSHSGVNLFNLAYLDGTWKIVNMVDTRE